LLDFGETAPTPTEPPPPVPLSPPADGGGGASLFGGLKIQSKASAAAAPSNNAESSVESLLGGMTVQETPAPATAFPFMQVSEAMAPAPKEGSAFGFMQESSAPPPPPVGSSFNFMQPSETPAASAIPAGSSFDFMQTGSQSAETEKQTGSSFGFMQSETTISSPNPTKPTFDPLAQNYQPSPTSQKQMMMQQQALNPVQLQAMYAQQLMMQQQMQQMQLAMAMQASGGGMMNAVPRNPNVMVPGGFAATNSFSFLDKGAQPQKRKEDKQFDFVQDAIKKEQK
jgi:hypothetical protein